MDAGANNTGTTGAAAPEKPRSCFEPRVFATQAHMDAAVVSELFIAGALAAVIGDSKLTKAGVKLAYDAYIAAAGNPADPIERMLVEQMLLIHYRLAGIHGQAAHAKTVEAEKILTTMAVRLLGELRRAALAVRQYRLPPGQKTFSVIHQQNVAASGGKQDVQYVDSRPDKETLTARDELSGKPADEGSLHEFRERVASGQEPGAGCSRPAERQVAAGLDA